MILFIINSLHFNLKLPGKEVITYATGVIALFVVLFIVYFISNRIIAGIEKKTGNDLLNRLRKNLKIPTILLITILAFWIPLAYTEVSESVTNAVNKMMSILLIVVFTWISIHLVDLVRHFVLKQYDIDQKDNLKARKVYTQFRIIQRILVFLILIIAISLALMTFSQIRKIGVSIIASAGVTGIIVGFAAQKVIGGVLAGVQLAFTQPIRLDDVVVVENEWGRIEEINLTYVVVRIWDQRRLVLPTTYFIEKPFQNWTRTSAEILGTVFIYTDYNVPFDKMREELTRLLQNSKLWDGKVNVLQVTDATEKTVEIRALMSAVDSPTAWDLRVYVREHLIRFIQENYPDSLPRSRVSIIKENEK